MLRQCLCVHYIRVSSAYHSVEITGVLLAGASTVRVVRVALVKGAVGSYAVGCRGTLAQTCCPVVGSCSSCPRLSHC